MTSAALQESHAPQLGKKPAAKAKKQLSKDTVSDSESEEVAANSSSEGEDEDEDEEEERDAENAPSTKYSPPESFNKLTKDNLPDTNPFSAKNLEGKELWFITAPASAPITKLSVVNPIDLAEGNPVLTTKTGRSFVLKPEVDDNEAAALRVLVPNKDGQYTGAVRQVSKTFTLAETLGQVRQLTESDIPTKPIRPQPKGLRQRFKPMGADSGDGDDAPVEDMMDIDEAPAAGKEERKKKRQKSSGEDGEKKKKKKKKTVESQ